MEGTFAFSDNEQFGTTGVIIYIKQFIYILCWNNKLGLILISIDKTY